MTSKSIQKMELLRPWVQCIHFLNQNFKLLESSLMKTFALDSFNLLVLYMVPLSSLSARKMVYSNSALTIKVLTKSPRKTITPFHSSPTSSPQLVKLVDTLAVVWEVQCTKTKLIIVSWGWMWFGCYCNMWQLLGLCGVWSGNHNTQKPSMRWLETGIGWYCLLYSTCGWGSMTLGWIAVIDSC